MAPRRREGGEYAQPPPLQSPVSSKQKNMVGTSLRRLTIKTLSSLQRSVGSAIVAYRRVCQKGAGSEGA